MSPEILIKSICDIFSPLRDNDTKQGEYMCSISRSLSKQARQISKYTVPRSSRFVETKHPR